MFNLSWWFLWLSFNRSPFKYVFNKAARLQRNSFSHIHPKGTESTLVSIWHCVYLVGCGTDTRDTSSLVFYILADPEPCEHTPWLSKCMCVFVSRCQWLERGIRQHPYLIQDAIKIKLMRMDSIIHWIHVVIFILTPQWLVEPIILILYNDPLQSNRFV